jgi:hypothetical protein
MEDILNTGQRLKLEEFGSGLAVGFGLHGFVQDVVIGQRKSGPGTKKSIRIMEPV